MSDSSLVKVVALHLPLLRLPLLLNNVINRVLSGLGSFHPLYLAQLVLISISTVVGVFDLIQYRVTTRASRTARTVADQNIQVAALTVTVDGGLSLGLLPMWIIGIVVFLSWGSVTLAIATFRAFIASSFHLFSFGVQAYVWLKFGRSARRRCPNCNHDLSLPAAHIAIPEFIPPGESQVQVQLPVAEATSPADEYDEYDADETDRLILKDEENQP